MRMLSRASVALALAFAFAVGAGCGDDEEASGPAAGAERGPCYGNKTCDAGLTCLSDLCVVGASDGGDGGAPAGNTGGSSGSGNSAAGKGPTDQGGSGDALGGAATAGAGNGSAEGGDAGAGGADGSLTPTAGALRVTWSLKGASSSTTLSCAAAGGTTVSVIGTRAGDVGALTEDLFDCADEGGDALYDFGSYDFSVQLLNAQSQALGDVVKFAITFDDAPCVEVTDRRCVKAKTVVLPVDGK